jgi:putative FmdB family regulatory protein
MPIFEFRCEDCGRSFELLQLAAGAMASACIHCGGTRTRKLYSAFATTSASSAASVSEAPVCGRCGSTNPCGSA